MGKGRLFTGVHQEAWVGSHDNVIPSQTCCSFDSLMEYLVLRKDNSEYDFCQKSVMFLMFSSEFLNNFIISQISVIC